MHRVVSYGSGVLPDGVSASSSSSFVGDAAGSTGHSRGLLASFRSAGTQSRAQSARSSRADVATRRAQRRATKTPSISQGQRQRQQQQQQQRRGGGGASYAPRFTGKRTHENVCAREQLMVQMFNKRSNGGSGVANSYNNNNNNNNNNDGDNRALCQSRRRIAAAKRALRGVADAKPPTMYTGVDVNVKGGRFGGRPQRTNQYYGDCVHAPGDFQGDGKSGFLVHVPHTPSQRPGTAPAASSLHTGRRHVRMFTADHDGAFVYAPKENSLHTHGHAAPRDHDSAFTQRQSSTLATPTALHSSSAASARYKHTPLGRVCAM
jgi:hypothetical protein